MKKMKQMEKRLALVLLVVFAFTALTGCYGKFPLTHAIYKLNGDITDEKIIHQIFFWGFLIIPIYEIAILGDIIILNLIEFWTGENIKVSLNFEQNSTEVALKTAENGQEATLSVTSKHNSTHNVRFVRVSDTKCQIQDANGKVVGSVITHENGDITMTNRDGSVISTLTAAQITAMKSK
jgi:hypothetical protein